MKKIVLPLTVLTIFVFAAAISKSFLNFKSTHDERVQATNVVIYANSSFMDSYGPGSELKAEFEKTCECKIEYFNAGGAAAAIEKIRLDPKRRVDLILGVDHLLLTRLANSVPLQSITRPEIPWAEPLKTYVYTRYIPYDWSPMGFIYRTGEVKPAHSWQELEAALPLKSLSLQDPSLSTPGLEFLYWLYATTPDLATSLENLKPIVHSYNPSWSASYGLFKNGQARVTFSYLTSLLYHWKNEKDERYQFMNFDVGHPLQVEYAVVPEACWNCGDAKKFIEFLLTPTAQKILAEKNFMMPIRNDVQLDEIFAKLPKVKVLEANKLIDFTKNQSELIELWKTKRP
jgi:thiamine transport system substrate-binding protein